LAAEAALAASPVLGTLEFERGLVIRTPARPEGVPVSTAAARLLALLDGKRTVAEAIGGLVERLDEEPGRRLASAALVMLQTLYSEGVFEELSPAGAPK
jgi:hypothetical protein